MSSAPHDYLSARLSPENKATLIQVLAYKKGAGTITDADMVVIHNALNAYMGAVGAV